METNQGAITIRLNAVLAPVTVRNFLNYAGDGFYDNTLVHYVDPGKMILAGGYSADRQAKPPRLPIRNEAHNGLKNTRGTIAMTRDPGQIDSATSQFFINLADAPQRDHQGDTPEAYGYCVFGEVIEGLDVAEKISQSSTSNLGGDLIQTPEPARGDQVGASGAVRSFDFAYQCRRLSLAEHRVFRRRPHSAACARRGLDPASSDSCASYRSALQHDSCAPVGLTLVSGPVSRQSVVLSPTVPYSSAMYEALGVVILVER